MATLCPELALRIGLAVRALPTVTPARLMPVLIDALQLPLTDRKLKSLTVQQLRSARRGALCRLPVAALDMPLGYRDLTPTAFLLSPSIPHLRTPSYSPDEIPKLSPDGATLASVVAYLLTTEPERLADLVARIRAVVPAVERLRVRPAKVERTEPTTITVNRKEIPYWENREVIGHELLFDLKNAPGIPARAVSEGTLLVTALLTAPEWVEPEILPALRAWTGLDTTRCVSPGS